MNETIVFALTSSVDLANEIVDHLNLPLLKLVLNILRMEKILVEPEETVRGRSVYIVQSTCAPVTLSD